MGATCIVFPKYVKDDPAKLFRTLKKHQVTALLGSPAFVHKVARYAADNNMMMPVLYSGVGGAPVFKKTFQTIASTTKEKNTGVVYGSTEAEPISFIRAQEKLQVESDDSIGMCVGKPVFENSVKVIKLLNGEFVCVPCLVHSVRLLDVVQDLTISFPAFILYHLFLLLRLPSFFICYPKY